MPLLAKRPIPWEDDVVLDFPSSEIVRPSPVSVITMDKETGLICLGESIRIWAHHGIIEFIKDGKFVSKERLTFEAIEDCLSLSSRKGVHFNPEMDSDGNPKVEKYWLPYALQPRTLALKSGKLAKKGIGCGCGKRT